MALNLENIEDIYYIIKEYNLYINEHKINNSELNSGLLIRIINIICKHINSFDNLNVIILFIIYNIVEKKIKIKKDTCKLLYDTLIYLYNNRNKSFLSEIDIDNIKYLIEYYKLKK